MSAPVNVPNRPAGTDTRSIADILANFDYHSNELNNIDDTHVKASAGIKLSKLETAADAKIPIGDGTKLVLKSISGDGALDDAGVFHVVAVQTGAVGTAGLAADAVTAAKIAPDAVGSSEIATDAVGAPEIAADSVGASELAPGAVGAPEMGAATYSRVQFAGTQSRASDTAVSWDSASSDTSGFWSAGASTRLTVPTGMGGLYIANGAIQFTQAGNGVYRGFLFQKNGTTYVGNAQTGYDGVAIADWNSAALNTKRPVAVGGTMFRLVAGDYIQMKVFHDHGSALDIVAADLAITRIGA